MKQISFDDLKRMMDEHADFVLIDARSHDAFDKEHIPGALSIPSDHLGPHLVEDYDEDTTFVTYCTDMKCEASTVAAKKLSRYGYKNVLEYKAGIMDWKAHRQQTVTKGH
jgi:rhodanese-related sulfurtransferase